MDASVSAMKEETVMAAQQQKKNYQRILEQTLEGIEKRGTVPTLLLHSCCAPCSSYVLEYLSQYFEITVFYYNPNIYPESEYRERAREEERLIHEMKTENPIHFLEGTYDPSVFYAMAKGHEKDLEGGERCFRCYELRLREGAAAARQGGFDYFTTTLSISPLKNAQKLNEIGIRLGEEYGVFYLQSDFKKKNGYKRSTELSAQYGLYRQNYCGCVFSQQGEDKLEKLKLDIDRQM